MESLVKVVEFVFAGYLFLSGTYVLIFVLKNKKLPPL